MRVGIIGANGFVGSGIRRDFRNNGIDSDVIERDNYREFLGASFDILINANGNSKKYLATEAPQEDFQQSVLSVQQSLTDFRYGLYIHCSSVDVYPDHANPDANGEEAPILANKISVYGFHKYLAEQLVRRYADRWLVLRFGGFVGEGLKKNSVYDILHDLPLRVHEDSAYQYLTTDTAGAVIRRLIDRRVEGKILNVCGEGCMTLSEIIAAVPDYQLRYAVAVPPCERYDVSISALRRFCEVPATRDSVLRFIMQQRAPNRSA